MELDEFVRRANQEVEEARSLRDSGEEAAEDHQNGFESILFLVTMFVFVIQVRRRLQRPSQG